VTAVTVPNDEHGHNRLATRSRRVTGALN